MNQDIFNEIAAKQEASADKMAAKCETTVPFHPVILVIWQHNKTFSKWDGC